MPRATSPIAYESLDPLGHGGPKRLLKFRQTRIIKMLDRHPPCTVPMGRKQQIGLGPDFATVVDSFL